VCFNNILQLRAAHAAGQKTAGLDMYNGKIADMRDLGVREAYKSKLKVPLLTNYDCYCLHLSAQTVSVLLL
jgi:chaperonin GroEL (HSP60 family)